MPYAQMRITLSTFSRWRTCTIRHWPVKHCHVLARIARPVAVLYSFKRADWSVRESEWQTAGRLSLGSGNVSPKFSDVGRRRSVGVISWSTDYTWKAATCCREWTRARRGRSVSEEFHSSTPGGYGDEIDRESAKREECVSCHRDNQRRTKKISRMQQGASSGTHATFYDAFEPARFKPKYASIRTPTDSV